MTETIARIYAKPQIASEAVEALKANGFDHPDVALVAYSAEHERHSNQPDTAVDQLTAQIMAARVLKAHARIYADRVSRGGSLVVVHAIFGRGALATRILDSFDPVDSGVAESHSSARPWDEAAPVSSALHVGVRLDQPTPFSAFWNLPVLIDGAASLSRLFHIPTLANHATSLSGAIGLPTLVSNNGSWSERMGIPVLLRRSRTAKV